MSILLISPNPDLELHNIQKNNKKTLIVSMFT